MYKLSCTQNNNRCFFNASKTSLKRFCCEKVLFTSTFESDIFCIATLRRGQRQGGWCDLCSDQVCGWRAPRSNQGSRSHDWVMTRERFLKQGVIWTKTCQNNVAQSTIAELMPKSGTTLQPGILPRRDLISEIWGISELLPDLWSAWSARRGTRPVWQEKFEIEIAYGLFIIV